MSDSGGVVAIIFSDLVPSAKVLDRLGDDAGGELRQTHFSLLRRAVTEVRGTEVKDFDDELVVALASPVQEVECAIGMQRP